MASLANCITYDAYSIFNVGFAHHESRRQTHRAYITAQGQQRRHQAAWAVYYLDVLLSLGWLSTIVAYTIIRYALAVQNV